MRTTLAIDDDILAAAKGLAAQEHKSIGQIVSALARQALQARLAASAGTAIRNGVPLLPIRADAVPVTPELIKELGDELP